MTRTLASCPRLPGIDCWKKLRIVSKCLIALRPVPSPAVVYSSKFGVESFVQVGSLPAATPWEAEINAAISAANRNNALDIREFILADFTTTRTTCQQSGSLLDVMQIVVDKASVLCYFFSTAKFLASQPHGSNEIRLST